jgi:hemolysin activation/secretion protein
LKESRAAPRKSHARPGLGALTAGVAVCASLHAHAQTPSPIVPPDRADQSPARPLSGPTPEQPKSGAMGVLPEIQPFNLSRVDVQGSTLPSHILEAAWRPYQGRTIDSRGLADLSNAILAAYERSEIALYTVLVPDQDFAGGVVRVNVLEGYVEDASIVASDDPRVSALVGRYLDELEHDRPLTKRTLQRYVSLSRDLPGVRTQISFVGGAASEAVRVHAKVDSDPVQVGLAVNNRGAAFLGRTQIAADLYLNNLVAGGQTRFTYATPTDTRLFRYMAVGHSQILGITGATLQFNAGHLRTRPRDSDLTGEATSAGAQLTYLVVRSYAEDLYVTVGLDGLNANSAFVGSTFSEDRSRAGRLNVFYSRQTDRRGLSLSGAVSVGIDALGARTLLPEVTELDYAKLNLRASFATSLGDRLLLRLAAAGQLTDDRLPAAEQFALGGSEFGRGYESAALIGDEGYAGSAEFAYRLAGLPRAFSEVEAYSFIDGGSTTYLRRGGAAAVKADLASTGIGVRATIRRNLALQLEGTKAIGDVPSPSAGDERLVFAIRTLW